MQNYKVRTWDDIRIKKSKIYFLCIKIFLFSFLQILYFNGSVSSEKNMIFITEAKSKKNSKYDFESIGVYNLKNNFK
jgi:hypothetical protein